MRESGRDSGIDALRAIAVLAMMAAHTSRLIDFDVREAWSYGVLLLEPLIPSLFLFLVGVSLTHSRAKADNARSWYLRQTRRAAGLWLISAVFFALEDGLRFPDMLMASGILCTITYAILTVGALLLLPKPVWMLGLALGAGISAFVRIDLAGAHPFWLVSGNSPLFPLLLFAAAGALWGLCSRRFPRAVFWIAPPALLLGAWLVFRHGWEPLFTKPLGRSDATRVLAPPILGGTEKSVPYYNLRPLLSLTCLCFHLSALGLVRFIHIGENWAHRGFALGRRALEAYVLHLFILAMLVVTLGMRPLRAAWQGNAVLAGVAAICWGWAWRRERGWPRFRRPR